MFAKKWQKWQRHMRCAVYGYIMVAQMCAKLAKVAKVAKVARKGVIKLNKRLNISKDLVIASLILILIPKKSW